MNLQDEELSSSNDSLVRIDLIFFKSLIIMRGTDLKFSTLLLSFKMLISGRERLLMGFGSALEWKMEINGQKRKKKLT